MEPALHPVSDYTGAAEDIWQLEEERRPVEGDLVLSTGLKVYSLDAAIKLVYIARTLSDPDGEKGGGGFFSQTFSRLPYSGW